MRPDTAGSETEFSRLVREHQVGVWRYLRVLGCDPDLAEDLTQETFVAVLQRPFEDLGHEATAAYLRKVARNLFISYQRRDSRYILLDNSSLENLDEIDDEWEEWGAADEGDSLMSALQYCLERLGERARLALEMRYREQLSRADIAHVLGMTENGAKNLMQRAKAALRECIGRNLG